MEFDLRFDFRFRELLLQLRLLYLQSGQPLLQSIGG